MPHPPATGALIHYHEIALKGKNRSYFLKQLADNLRTASQDLDVGRLRRPAGRLFLEMHEDTSWEALRERLGWVFGIANFAAAFRVPPDLELMAKRIEAEVSGRSFASFAVAARRAFKSFPQTSQEINQVVGDRKSTRLNSSHIQKSRMPSSA